jgi:CRP-like cAMP-binding protein
MKPKKLWEKYFKALTKQDWQKALSSLNSLKELEPENSQVYLKIGDTLQRIGDIQGAVAAYHQSASCLVNAGFGQKALAIYKIILRLEPNNEEAINKSEAIFKEMETSKTSLLLSPAIVSGVEEIPASEEPLSEESTGLSEPPYTEETKPVPSIFSSLTNEEYGELLRTAEVKSFKHGETIIEEGDAGDSMFIIRRGKARVIAHLLGKVIELAMLSENDVFGEVAFLTGRPRTASVIAEGELEVFEINRITLQEAIEKNPQILDSLQDFYHSRVQDTIKKVKSEK